MVRQGWVGTRALSGQGEANLPEVVGEVFRRYEVKLGNVLLAPTAQDRTAPATYMVDLLDEAHIWPKPDSVGSRRFGQHMIGRDDEGAPNRQVSDNAP